MNMTGKDVLDRLGIPVLYMADMRLPTVLRSIELFREDIAITVNKMARTRGAAEHDAAFTAEDVRTVLRWTEEYIHLNPLLCFENETRDEIMPGVERILEQLRSLLPSEVAV